MGELRLTILGVGLQVACPDLEGIGEIVIQIILKIIGKDAPC
jgi:hypothetical protein